MIRCVVRKSGLKRRSGGVSVPLLIGQESDFTEASVAWLVPQGIIEVVVKREAARMLQDRDFENRSDGFFRRKTQSEKDEVTG